MFTNQVINDAHEKYFVNACLEEQEGRNYIKIGDKVIKCGECCMMVYYTLYIYACSYEDALTKIANNPRITNYTIEEKVHSVGGKKMIYIVCPMEYVKIETSNSGAMPKISKVLLNDQIIYEESVILE